MFWIAKARTNYNCDVCGNLINKGEKRLVYGIKGIYVMIDKNICLDCFKTKSIDTIISEGKFTQSQETFNYLCKELDKFKLALEGTL